MQPGVTIPAGKADDEARTELSCEGRRQVGLASVSQASDSGDQDLVDLCSDGGNRYLADPSVGTPFSANAANYAATVSNEHPTEKTHRRGPDRVADIAAMMESSRGLSHSDKSLLDVIVHQNARASNHSTSTKVEEPPPYKLERPVIRSWGI